VLFTETSDSVTTPSLFLLALIESESQRVRQVFFPAVEPHVNGVATAILSESGMKGLMDIADKMGKESTTRTAMRVSLSSTPPRCETA
jgi:hypothetical protein